MGSLFDLLFGLIKQIIWLGYFSAHGSEDAQGCLISLLSTIFIVCILALCGTYPVLLLIIFFIAVVWVLVSATKSNTPPYRGKQTTHEDDGWHLMELEADRKIAEERKKEEDRLLALPEQVGELLTYRYVMVDNVLGMEIVTYNGFDEQKIEIPESIDGYPVLRIGEKAFYNSKITSICLPDSVKEIGNSAFYNCSLLKQVRLSLSLTFIGEYVFRNCKKITAIDLPESLRTLEKGIFFNSGLRRIRFPSRLGTIPSCCCYDCMDLTTVHIPEGVARIESDAFAVSREGTDTLASIVIPASVIQLGFGVFTRRKIRVAVLGMQTKVESVYLPSDWSSASCYVLAGSEMQQFAREHRLTVRPLSEFGELNTDKAIEPAKREALGEEAPAQENQTKTQNPPEVQEEDRQEKEARLLALPEQTGERFTYRYTKIDDVLGIEIVVYLGFDEQKIELPESIDGYPVLRIGDNAFSNSKITSICLPDSVKEIGNSAFCNCLLLEQVQFSSSLTVIEELAFFGCEKLLAMNLPESLKILGTSVFSGSGLQSIRFPSALETIPAGCCSGCNDLTTVYIPESIQTIESYAFAATTSSASSTLTSIVIPASVTHIEGGVVSNREIRVAFLGMKTKAENVRLHDEWSNASCYVLEGSEMHRFARKHGISVKTLSEFSGLDAYKAIESAKQEALGEEAPAQENQTETQNPPEVQEENKQRKEARLLMMPDQIGERFTYRYKKIDNVLGIEIVAYNGLGEQKIDIPESINGYPVLRIGEKAFDDSKITAVCLPDSVKEIGKQAFNYCSLLEQVQLSSSLTVIEEEAFRGCRRITAIELPESLKILGASVFSRSGLKSIRFPSALETIPEACCDDCMDLTNVYIPEGVRTIGGYAFAAVTSSASSTLPSIVFPASVQYIGSGVVSDRAIRVAFLGILTEVENSRLRNAWYSACCYVLAGSKMQQFARKNQIPYRPLAEFGELDPYKAIDPAEQKMLEEAKLIEAPERISGLFTYRYKQIDDAMGIEIVAYNGFDEQIIEIPESIDGSPVLRIGEQAFSHSKIVSIRLSDSVKEIGKHAFFGCLLLQQVQLSSSLTVIEEEAFWVCERISAMDLPEGLRTLGKGVFSYCGFKSIRFPSTLDTIPENCCYECRGLTTVYIPEGVQTIESRAFEVKRTIARLKSIVIPTSVKRLESDAFWNRKIQIEYRAMQTAGETK